MWIQQLWTQSVDNWALENECYVQRCRCLTSFFGIWLPLVSKTAHCQSGYLLMTSLIKLLHTAKPPLSFCILLDFMRSIFKFNYYYSGSMFLFVMCVMYSIFIIICTIIFKGFSISFLWHYGICAYSLFVGSFWADSHFGIKPLLMYPLLQKMNCSFSAVHMYILPLKPKRMHGWKYIFK